jgi:hypothetical protein
MTTPTSPITPPRAAERLLEALGAEAEFRDALLGDLAEEHAIRAAYDGERAAGRWYRREALRVAPHLVRDGARRLGWRGVRRLAGVVLTAYTAAHFVHIALSGTMMQGVVLLAGNPHTPRYYGSLQLSWAHPIRGALALAMLLTFTALAPVVSGFVAASTEDEAPLFPALALGALQLGLLCIQLAVGLPGPTGPAWLPGPSVPAWVLGCQCVLVVAGPAVGAVLRISDRPRPAAE